MDTTEISIYENHSDDGDGKGTGMVKPEDINLLHERLFEILAYFDEFCEEHGLRYSLAEGTCLGAVRENDFVPWDDDLDVAMLRNDFNKLFELWDKFGDKEHFSLYRTDKNFCAYTPIGLMRNNSTTFIRDFETGLTDRNLGVKIDIAPLDEIPEDPRKRKKQRFFALLYVLFLTQRKPRHKSKNKKVNIVANVLLDVFRNRKIRNLIVRITEPQVTKYNGTGCPQLGFNGVGKGRGCLWNMSEIMNLTRMPFHGKEFCVPADYDGYLSRGYGDYMKKPSLKYRKPLDTPAYYDLNTPYSEYLKSLEKSEDSAH